MKPDREIPESEHMAKKAYHTPDLKQYGDLRDIAKGPGMGSTFEGYYDTVDKTTS